MVYENELKVAINTVSKASELCQKVQRTLCHTEAIAKKDRSPVTIADFGSQAFIISEILKYFPNDPVVGEEEADVLRSNESIRSQVYKLVRAYNKDITEDEMLDAIDHGAKPTDFKKRYWTLDPIDGTKGFLRGDQYAIALALVENGKPVLGVLGCPNLPVNDEKPNGEKGCLLYASSGCGAFQKNLGSKSVQQLFVNDISDPNNAWFCESVEKGHSSHDVQKQIGDVLGITKAPYRIDSQCKYAIVARGGVPIYIRLARGKDYQEKIWDHAAGSFIVKEAGGRVTDFFNKNLNFSSSPVLDGNRGVLATNGVLHNNVLEAIFKVISE
jgi:HAL2 family 3'(2'),5'-bisphosphate nucleotidase